MKFLFAVFGFNEKDTADMFLETYNPDLGLRQLVVYDDEELVGNLEIDDCDEIFIETMDIICDYYVVVPLTAQPVVLERRLLTAS